MHSSIGNTVPKIHAVEFMRRYRVFYQAINKKLITSAISLTRGGLGVALTKAALAGRLGLEVSLHGLPGQVHRNDFALFSESQGRLLVTVDPTHKIIFEATMRGTQIKHIGLVTNNQQIIIKGFDKKTIVCVDLNQLNRAYTTVFKDY